VKQKGFTLAELAIVVTIIGFLLVAVLGSQGLIGRAQSKDVIAIVEDLRSATNFFRQRYNYLPGDWPYTANEITGVVAATGFGTNGDGYIDGAVDASGNAAATSEVAELPWQLYQSGLLGKIDTGDPRRRIKTSFGAVHVVSRATADGLVAGFAAANPAARNAILFFNLPCDIATEVDTKIDNGDLASGRGLGTACVNGIVQWYAVVL